MNGLEGGARSKKEQVETEADECHIPIKDSWKIYGNIWHC